MAEAAWINADAGAPEYNAQELRRLQSMHLFPGVSDRVGARQGVRPTGQDVVTVSGTTWTQHDLSAVVYPGLTTVSGPYVVEKLAESGSLDPADGSNDRLDGLDLQVQDDDEDASGQRQVRVVYVPGTPASTPSPPPVTDTSLRLATILVPAGGTPSPTVATLAQYTVSAGGILPLRQGEAAPAGYPGVYVDSGGALQRGDGAGNFTPVAAPNSPTLVVYDTSGSFDKADFPWARKVRPRVQGAGAGGGGTASTASGEAASGAGGGGGGYAEALIDIADLEPSVTVTIGVGGSGGSPGSNNGSSGASSAFGSHVIGEGASGGQGGTNTGGLNVTDGGAGGGGSINTGVGFVRPGGPGHNGSNDQAFVHNHGFGGDAMLGTGGRTSGVNVGGAGGNGGGNGGGGAGAFASPSQPNLAGGDGADGQIVVEVY